jgi:hypothetical protein
MQMSAVLVLLNSGLFHFLRLTSKHSSMHLEGLHVLTEPMNVQTNEEIG